MSCRKGSTSTARWTKPKPLYGDNVLPPRHFRLQFSRIRYGRPALCLACISKGKRCKTTQSPITHYIRSLTSVIRPKKGSSTFNEIKSSSVILNLFTRERNTSSSFLFSFLRGSGTYLIYSLK